MSSYAENTVVYKKTSKFGIYDVTDVARNSDRLTPTIGLLDSRPEAERLFNRVYETVTYERAKDASLDSRAKMTAAEKVGLTYGEVVFKSMQKVFERLRIYSPNLFRGDGGLFYDLGSGSGRPVVMAATLHSFSVCSGIEILPSLHDLALEAKSSYDMIIFENSSVYPKVNFVLGSILNLDLCDWTDGDIVFSNSTAFDDCLFEEMSTLALRMKPGSLMVTLTANIVRPEYFEVLEELRLDMSW
jgi:SAM-dependent methyltransferase